MRLSRALASMLLAVVPSARALAAPAADPVRVLPTPSGCAVVLDVAGEEYRIDRLVDGGVTIGLLKSKIPPQERQLTGSCLERYRVSASLDGQGSTVELRPAGHEFSALIRSGSSLKLAFEKVADLSGGAAPASADRFYKVGNGDQLAITVFTQPDLTVKTFVGDDGTIDYPLIGHFKVAGKTVREVQEALTAELGSKYIVNPQVSVEMATYKSQFAFVTGAVRKPGKVPLETKTTLKDALSTAEGMIPEAGYTITVARQAVGADGLPREPERFTFSRSDIESGFANLDLKPNDVVTVSEKDYFYIQGEVRKPGKYEMRPGLTLLQAIAVAEGLTDWADRKSISLIRKVGGRTDRQTFNLKNIERQKAPDTPLVADDIIILARRIL